MSHVINESFVFIPFGSDVLAMSHQAFTEAKEMGRAFMHSPDGSSEPHIDDEILDAEGMGELTNIPASWFKEQARQKNIPFIKAGKYVRFSKRDVLNTLKVNFK